MEMNMQRVYRIDVIAHFKPARYSSTYFLDESAKDEFYRAKRLWEGSEDENDYGYDDFARIPGSQRTAVQAEIDSLEASDPIPSDQEERLEALYKRLDELEDDTLTESWYQRDILIRELQRPYVVLDEFEAYTE